MRPRKPFLRIRYQERTSPNWFFYRRLKSSAKSSTPVRTFAKKPVVLLPEKNAQSEVKQWKTLGAKAANYFNNLATHLDIPKKMTAFSCDPLQLTLSLIEEMRICYDRLKTIITDGLMKTSQDKKLLLLVGEDYYSKKSLIFTLMLLHIAKRHDIQHLLAEIPEQALAHINDMETSKSIEKPNLGYVLPLAKNKLSMTITGADHANYTMVCNEIREDYMLQQALTINENAIFIMGAGHLQKLMNSEFLNQKNNIVGINISECDPNLPTAWINEYIKQTHLTEKEIMDRINFLSDPDKIQQCALEDTQMTGLVALPPEDIISVVEDYCKNRVWAEEVVISGDKKRGMFR